MTTTPELIDFKRVNNDVNGNPRYVCHYLNFITDKDFVIGTRDMTGDEVINYVYGMSRTDYGYQLAIKRANKIGGRKFHNKQYGGGIVFQMYSGEQEKMSKRIQELLQTGK